MYTITTSQEVEFWTMGAPHNVNLYKCTCFGCVQVHHGPCETVRLKYDARHPRFVPLLQFPT